MDNENIKEILELLKEDLYIPQEDNREYKLLDKGDDKLLLDYITNLQQKEELLRHEISDVRKAFNGLQQINNNQAKRNSRQRLANQKQQDLILNLQQIEQEHKKINGELREENSKLEIALQNIQEDYNKRTKEINYLNEELETRQQDINNLTYQLAKLKEENERLKEQTKKDNHILGCNFASKDKYKQRYEDYKSRCEKAMKFIENCLIPYGDEWHWDDACIRDYVVVLLNILQNGSDSQ